VRVGGFRLYEVAFAAGDRKPLHEHDSACVCFSTRGAFDEGIRGRTHRFAPFEVSLKAADELHWDSFDDGPVTMLSVNVLEPRLTQIRETTGLFRTPHVASGGAVGRLARRIHETFRLEAGGPSDLLLEGLLLELMGSVTALRPQGAADAAFRRATDFIRDNFARSFTVDDVAAAARVHPAQLARLFRARAHCSVGDFVRSVRVEHAKDLLRRDGVPLADVAQQAGFCDQSHLTRVFREQTRSTPAAFRRAMREPA